ncbi:TrbC/VirB2 family protein, partial [Omnitrophica bacterium]|nr:TrbC/VirB2 family protein [Candidatus Omnitrophota bacterium]
MKTKIKNMIQKILFFVCVFMIQAQLVFAEANAEGDLDAFLIGVGDFLIRTIGPGVLVIGVAVAGVSMALGDEQGMRRGALAAGGGALIMLSRAVLDFIQNVAGF